jgi:hypothetical protein
MQAEVVMQRTVAAQVLLPEEGGDGERGEVEVKVDEVRHEDLCGRMKEVTRPTGYI